jgi:hypothetical protein
LRLQAEWLEVENIERKWLDLEHVWFMQE